MPTELPGLWSALPHTSNTFRDHHNLNLIVHPLLLLLNVLRRKEEGKQNQGVFDCPGNIEANRTPFILVSVFYIREKAKDQDRKFFRVFTIGFHEFFSVLPRLCITQIRCDDQLSNRMKAEGESSWSSAKSYRAKSKVILLKLLLPLIEVYFRHFARHSPKMSHINNCQGRIKKLVFVLGKTLKTGVGHGQDSLTSRMCLLALNSRLFW